MTGKNMWLAIVLAAAAACGPAKDDASGNVDPRYNADSLGALSFSLTEGTPAARTHFRRGLLALHSFWYDEALRQFTAAAEVDPTMNLAHWGVAMSHLKLLWGEDDITAAKLALAKMRTPDTLPPREQAWILATLELMRAPDVRTSRVAYAAAMEKLNAEFPDDESATFLAIALLSTIRPEDPDNLAVRERAATLAASVYTRNPRHPGAAHYLIHALDTPELAPKALDAATAYSHIAPAAFHAQHMPAHIYSRLGMWAKAIASCRAAWDSSVAAARREKLTSNAHDFHSLSWLIEMPFELGQRKDAAAALTQFGDAVKGGLAHQHRGVYATAVGSYLARTGEWTRVDELLAPLATAAVDGPRTNSDCGADPLMPAELGEQLAVLETRALAAAMQRELATTKKLIAEIDSVRARIAPLLPRQPTTLALALDAAYARKQQAWLAHAASDDNALIAVLQEAVKVANVATGGENNPSAFVANEELGDALLRANKPEEARAAYDNALREHPGRAHSLLGAARAATAKNDATGAARYYGELRTLWSTAEPTTPGLDEVRGVTAPTRP